MCIVLNWLCFVADRYLRVNLISPEKRAVFITSYSRSSLRIALKKLCFPSACTLTLQKQGNWLLYSMAATRFRLQTNHTAVAGDVKYVLAIYYTVRISLLYNLRVGVFLCTYFRSSYSHIIHQYRPTDLCMQFLYQISHILITYVFFR
jgi:hypothetical protein